MAKLPGNSAPRPTPQPTRGQPNYSKLESVSNRAVETAGVAAKVGAKIAMGAAEEKARTFAEAEARLNARRESVERIRMAQELQAYGSQLFTEFESSRDLSRQEDVAEFGQRLNEKYREMLGAYQGSEEGRLRLEERLWPIMGGITDKVGVASVKAQDALVNRAFDEVVSQLSARVRFGEDPRVLINEGMQFLKEEGDALRPGQEVDYTRQLNNAVWSAKISDYLARNAIDEAEELLSDPDVQAAISPKSQNEFFNRIAKARNEGRTRILTPTEMANMGFPEDTIAMGLVVQQKPDGAINVVFNPPKDRDEDTRAKKIKAIEDQLVRGGSDSEEAKDRATNIVDGNIRIEIVPATGKAREINDLDGTVKEVPLGDDIPIAQKPPQRTLFDLAKSGSIAGIWPFAKELWSETVGQIPGVPVAEHTVEARQEMREAQNGLIRALSINPRFPVGEINRLRQEIKIEPKLFDSQRALISRMRGVHNSLSIRLENERRAANDPNLPETTRSAAAQAANDIQNFLNRLGNPVQIGDLPPEGVPEFSVRIGRTKGGADVWQSPDGKTWAVE